MTDSQFADHIPSEELLEVELYLEMLIYRDQQETRAPRRRSRNARVPEAAADVKVASGSDAAWQKSPRSRRFAESVTDAFDGLNQIGAFA
jgi:hypothetical protein